MAAPFALTLKQALDSRIGGRVRWIEAVAAAHRAHDVDGVGVERDAHRDALRWRLRERTVRR